MYHQMRNVQDPLTQLHSCHRDVTKTFNRYKPPVLNKACMGLNQDVVTAALNKDCNQAVVLRYFNIKSLDSADVNKTLQL